MIYSLRELPSRGACAPWRHSLTSAPGWTRTSVKPLRRRLPHPLDYGRLMERETGLEPATTCLEGRYSTIELLPQSRHFKGLPRKLSRDDWIRTSDPLLPKQMRYQAALRPVARFTSNPSAKR